MEFHELEYHRDFKSGVWHTCGSALIAFGLISFAFFNIDLSIAFPIGATLVFVSE